MFNRTYGIEIEAIGPASLAPAGFLAHGALRKVAEEIAADGVPCQFSGYSHATTRHWKVVTDSSLNTEHMPGGHPMEIVSPPLSGEEGIEQINKVCAVLVRLGLKVNKSCGLHVHVDARNIPVTSMRRLAAEYARFEPIIDTMVPESRRASNNNYCKSIRGFNMTALSTAATVTDIARLAGNNDRFRKLNFTAFWRHGTVEFRQHSGTVEADKAINWTKFCLRMVERAISNPTLDGFAIPAAAIAPVTFENAGRRRRMRNNTKLALIAGLLLRQEGCTAREILEATGWPSVSVQQQATAAGLNLRVVRRGRVCRYYGSNPLAAPVAAPSNAPALLADPTFDSMMDDLGLAQDERAYWKGRAESLAIPRLRASREAVLRGSEPTSAWRQVI